LFSSVTWQEVATYACRELRLKALNIFLANLSFSIPLLVRVSFFEHKSITHVILRYLPLSLNVHTIEGARVVNVVLADVLLDESNVAIGIPVATNGEFTNIVATSTLYLPIEDIQVINCHLMIGSIVMILSLPHLVGARHMELAA
jgi:hypothetical protein